MSTFTTSIAVLLVLAVVAGYFLWRYKRDHPEGYAEHEADLLREWDRLHPRPTPVVVPYVPPVEGTDSDIDYAALKDKTRAELALLGYIGSYGQYLNGFDFARWQAATGKDWSKLDGFGKPIVAGPAIAIGLTLPGVGVPISNRLLVGHVYEFTFDYVGWANVEWSETVGTDRTALITSEFGGQEKSAGSIFGHTATVLCSGPSVARLTTNVDTQLMCVLRQAQAPRAPR